ncbi:unnamed protein product [Adineta steineri]|uniref:B box-type domain-containing protein n=1 Tax=Adineta steineri TaxID=433720 RepID=A0A816B996_9BILA|nr:unnamed protein product [Adineta steineri]CAF1604735.1 unnamed protein product [Adineta steineri]
MSNSNQCSTCQKPAGIIHCAGCDSYFCTKDFRGHREILYTEMEELVEECNKLQENVNKATKGNDLRNPLLKEINAWEKITIEKVQQTAEQARQRANQLMNSKSTIITTEFIGLSDELAGLKETENYVEHDLTRLKQKIDQFNIDLTQLSQAPRIELNSEESKKIKWDCIIYVQEKSERAQTSKSLPQEQLLCGGRACVRCGKCSDGHYDSNMNRYRHRDGSICNPFGTACDRYRLRTHDSVSASVYTP